MGDPTPDPETPPKPPITQYLTHGDLRSAYLVLGEVFRDDPEPIPPWDNADPVLLDTCRCCIEVEAFGAKKYPDLPSAVAKLFYSTIKLHSFPNANKRFALVLSLLLLIKNGYTLTAPAGMGAEVAKFVADSDPHNPETAPDEMIAALTQFFVERIAPRDTTSPSGEGS